MACQQQCQLLQHRAQGGWLSLQQQHQLARLPHQQMLWESCLLPFCSAHAGDVLARWAKPCQLPGKQTSAQLPEQQPSWMPA